MRRTGDANEQLPNPEGPLRPDDVLVLVGSTGDIERFAAVASGPPPAEASR